ncbi:hypothetical protein [Streptomyces sp. NPDC005780]|uniref:hypothetical protein n=1 Tax=Streptomyces sp. NPDC005780 TaxID=3364730 RepID=UPI0036B3861B
MTGLGIIWPVHHRTGSYAAGLMTGGFAVADALAGPDLVTAAGARAALTRAFT